MFLAIAWWQILLLVVAALIIGCIGIPAFAIWYLSKHDDYADPYE